MPESSEQLPYTKLDGADFVASDTIQPFSLSVEGLECTGKTRLSLMTTPTPVVHVNFSDRSAAGWLYSMDAERRKATRLYDFRANTATGWTRPEGLKSLAALSQVAQDEMSDGKLAGGTFVIDSGSTWWDVIQEVYVAPEAERQQREFGKQLGGLAFGSGNLIVKGIVNWLKAQGAFVILTHQMAPLWDTKGPVPGAYKARINSQVSYMVEVRLQLIMKCNTCGSTECYASGHVGRTHYARIVKFGNTQDGGSNYIGMELPDPNFTTIYKLYTGRDLPTNGS